MPMKTLARFLSHEASSGIVLLTFALLAFACANSPFASQYDALWQTNISVSIGPWSMARSLTLWINEGLMSLFFLLVGLELKREFIQGELGSVRQVLLPGIAALGGMIVPALLYGVINWGQADSLQGWAVPVATDIAFAVGVLALFGRRIPIALKLFLLALAIFDDVGAILIIAVFHTHDISYAFLGGALLTILVLLVCNGLKIRTLWLYIPLGVLLWWCVVHSGIHATLSGVMFALLLPLSKGSTLRTSPALRVEKMLHPWVAYGVIPLFALANAGFSLKGITLAMGFSPVTLGIIVGLLLGKQLGVFGFAGLAIRLKWAALPQGSSWRGLYGVAILCGIGFTMSLFLGTLAFPENTAIYLIEVRLGVLIGSIASGCLGAWVLHSAFRHERKGKRV